MNIISYSLFGSIPKYCEGAIRNAEAAKVLFKGWIPRFYVDKDSVPQVYIDKLSALGCQIILKKMFDNVGAYQGTFWRFAPLYESGVGKFISRDTETVIDRAYREMVRDWEFSGKDFFIISYRECQKYAILGSWFGGKGNLFPELNGDVDTLFKNGGGGIYGDDEFWLHTKVWPLVKDKALLYYRWGKVYVSRLKSSINSNREYIIQGSRPLRLKVETEEFSLKNEDGFDSSRPKKEKHFYIDHKSGDILYGLPTYKSLGGIFLKLYKRCLNPGMAKVLLPLLEVQPYIGSVRYGYLEGETRIETRILGSKDTIARTVLKKFHLPLDLADEPWLFTDNKYVSEVIIHRSFRYLNSTFPWVRILEKYRGRVVFVGLSEEHSEFERLFGSIPFFKTSNFLELAQIINGCKLFIGSQSSPLAIAEGLKKDIVVQVAERGIGGYSCRFIRKGAVLGFGKDVVLPDVV